MATKKKPTTRQTYKNGVLTINGVVQTPKVKNPKVVPVKNKNVFTNKYTGVQTDRYGVATTSTAVADPVASYAEIGAANIQAEYDANLEAELDLTGSQKGYTSLDEYIKDQYASQAENTALQQEQLDLQRIQNGEQVSSQKNILEGQLDVAASGLAGAREGATSTSNQSTYDRLKDVTGTQISRMQRDRDLANKAISQAKTDLARAERAGNTELASKYRQQILSATSAAQQVETDLASALSGQLDAENNQMQIKQAGIQTFQGLVEGGTEMDYNTVAGYAGQLGLPTDVLMGYYQGAQSIRDDKTLSLEDKQVALDQAKQDLNDQISGMDIEAVKSASVYNDMVKSGQYTTEQLQVISSAMGISDQYNESYQAQLAYDTASAKIQQQIANGELVNPLDLIDLATKTYALSEAMGQTQGGVPTGGGSAETTAMATQDGGIRFGFEDGTQISSAKRALSQCGQFVNDTLGIAVGDSLGSKMAYVDQSILVPVPGMGFVTDRGYDLPGIGNSGHTGIVEYYDPETGMVGVADVNYNGDGLALHHEIPLAEFKAGTNNGGFMPLTSDSTPVGGDYSYGSYYNQAVNELGLPEEEAQKWATDITTQIATGQFKNEAQSKDFKSYSNMVPENEVYMQATKDMTDEELEDYANNAGYLNLQISDLDGETPLTSQLINEHVTDPVARELIYAEQRWLAGKLRGDSGAAITIGEYISTGSQFWPRKGDDAATIKLKQQARENNQRSYYSTMGPVGQAIYQKTVAEYGVGYDEEDYSPEWSTFIPIEEELDGIN